MTAFASLVLNNNAAAAITFSPVGRDTSGVSKWLSTDSTIFDAKKSITMSVSLPKNGSSVIRVKQRVVIPIMDSVVTDKKVAEAYVNVEFVLPKTSTTTNRLDLRKFVDGLVLHAASTAAIQDFEDQY